MKKRLLSLVLTAMLLISVLPGQVHGESTGDSAIPASIVDSLKEKFPAGKFWNHTPGTAPNSDSWTETPCTHHEGGDCTSYDGYCGCNRYDSAIQCMGFAFKLASECFTGSARKWKEVHDLDGIKAGDIIRMNGHSVFVTAVRGEMVVYADCNIDHQCIIRWDTEMSKTLMRSRLEYRLVSPNQMVPESPRVTVKAGYHQWDTVTASWSAVSGVDRYVVKIQRDGESLTSFHTTDTSYSFVAKEAGEYELHVSAKNSMGQSPAAMEKFTVEPHACASKDFWDVPNYDNWSHEGIDYAVATGLFNGISEDRFSPEGMMTRAMIATVLWRNSGSPNVTGDMPYTDVPQNAWYAKAVLWAYKNQVMNGMGEGLFAPDANLNREQIVTVLHRYAVYQGVSVSGTTSLNSFADAGSVSLWAKEAMQWAVASQIIKGSDDGTGKVCLYPQSAANRAQVAAILMRFVRDYIRVPAAS